MHVHPHATVAAYRASPSETNAFARADSTCECTVHQARYGHYGLIPDAGVPPFLPS
jgi:hypothetical protein